MFFDLGLPREMKLSFVIRTFVHIIKSLNKCVHRAMYTIALLIVKSKSLNIGIANICICCLNEDLISFWLIRLKNKKKSVIVLLEYI